jgi:hypothetical protein
MNQMVKTFPNLLVGHAVGFDHITHEVAAKLSLLEPGWTSPEPHMETPTVAHVNRNLPVGPHQQVNDYAPRDLGFDRT